MSPSMSPSMTPSMKAPSMSPAVQYIDCAKTDKPDECSWYSPSNLDRSGPNSKLMCPPNMDRCWMDSGYLAKGSDIKNPKYLPREFKCGACDVNNHSQTNACHISLLANSKMDTTNWESNMTKNYSKNCKNKWRQY